ncbi:hypothetical protein HMPREF1624_04252 [Sporothrix schenckii ATCC 58251]|uniref:Methyltransferase type 11 domain-containing protein n=1 Tax=Sporothrix schenckii (strain ATCC 58251 / de Perez 2211183) TaxID=1391915 RepID=U7PTY4_SPOS1|nr:hypothetical protein HMPREF1624_04252 [Sporothrix schenckii ATCC 58251]
MSVTGSRAAGMVAQNWRCSYQTSMATPPRMKRPPAKEPASKQPPAEPNPSSPSRSNTDRVARIPQTRAAPLPYRPLPFASSDKSKQDDQQQQQQGKKEKGKEKPEALDSLFSQRKLPLIGAALAAGVLGFYIMPLLITYLKGGCRDDHQHAEVAPDAIPTGLPPVGAAAFDASLDVPERIMGIKHERKKLASGSSGAVLEVAVGTGRNVSYYVWDPATFTPSYIRSSAATADLLNGNKERPKITSFTGVDLSGEALGMARTQLRVTVPAVAAAIPKKAPAIDDAVSADAEVVSTLDGKVRLIRGDAMQPLPLPAPSTNTARYDTVVQTFGLCSVADPVVLIANMAAVVKPETGRIVLLEHGRGSWSVVNSLLDQYASRHFARFGCWWNRDMAAIVAKAQETVPGLEVVSVKRPGWLQFGTLWKIELRVREAAAKK